MKIRMTQTQRGAADGMTVVTYVEGQEYDLSGTPRALELAAVFVREGWAEEVRAGQDAPPAETPPPARPAPATDGRRRGR